MKITKGVTDFSSVFIPNYTGLLENDLITTRNLQASKELLTITVTHQFRLIGGTEIFDVLTSKSVFDIKTDGKISPEEVRSIDENAMTVLREHLNMHQMAENLSQTNVILPPLLVLLYN